MRKVHVKAYYGFHNCFHEEEFEFPDEYTNEEIEDELWEWAAQYVEIAWKEVKNTNEGDDN